jgi:hypothetical protein
VLAWEAVTGFADGLAATWEWYAERRRPVGSSGTGRGQ